ncbi:MAG: M48 family metalloprotease [Acidobacteria bacterium]|nr:M48 family metalloprotease [Acidobacteriota bacterium]
MRRVWLTGALMLIVAVPATAQIGGFLDKASKAAQVGKKIMDLKISEDEEQQIGAAVSEKVRQRYGVVQDPAVHKYVALVGAVVTQASTRPGIAWQFIILDTDGVNAFAAPGGFIHITRGALALMGSEAELAGVLAHEAIHVTERHTINAIRNTKLKDMGLELAPGGGLTKAAINKIAGEAYNMIYAGYSRGEELESDRLGIVLANKAGYDPKGLGGFLAALTARNKGASEKQGLFASHPEMKERLEKLDQMIVAQKLTSTVVLADRYRSFITYQPKAQTEITQVVAGSSGLAGGTKEEPKKEDAAPPKKRGFGLGSLLKPGGEEKKSAQVTGSGGSRGVDTERGAPGGGNPAIVVVKLTAAEIAQFKADGKLR